MAAPCPQVFGKPEVISPENWLLNQFKQYHGLKYAVLTPSFNWLYAESFTRGMSAYLGGLHLKSGVHRQERFRQLTSGILINGRCHPVPLHSSKSRNTNFITPSSELGAEIEPNTVENQNIDEPLGEISHDDKKSSNEQNENEEGKPTAPIELLGEVAILICEAENIEVKPFLPLLEEKVMEEAQKFASAESEDDEETSDESSDSNMKSICCSNSNYGENEESYDDSKEN